MLAIVALWGAPALIRTHGQFFAVGIGRHVISRSFTTMEGHGANSFGMYLLLLPFYFVTIFVSFFPWSIKLPWLTRQLWQDRDKIDNYLITGVVIIFVIFTSVKTKLPHYTLPVFPLLALLLPAGWPQKNQRVFLKKCAVASVSIYLGVALIVPSLVPDSFRHMTFLWKSRGSLRADMEFGAVSFSEPSLVWYFRSRVTVLSLR